MKKCKRKKNRMKRVYFKMIWFVVNKIINIFKNSEIEIFCKNEMWIMFCLRNLRIVCEKKYWVRECKGDVCKKWVSGFIYENEELLWSLNGWCVFVVLCLRLFGGGVGLYRERGRR